MKKLISLLMIAAMTLSLAACSGGTEASDSSTSSGTEAPLPARRAKRLKKTRS